MFVLSLRRLDAPKSPPLAIARSEHRSHLLGLMQSCFDRPVLIDSPSGLTIRVFAPNSVLAEYMLPDPMYDNEGVLRIGTHEERLGELMGVARIQMERQVKEAYDELIANTFDVKDPY